MTKSTASIILLLLSLLPVTGAARTVADLLASEPGNIFALLTRTNRLDMIDYRLNNQEVAIQNLIGGESRLEGMDTTWLKLRTSDSKTVEMRMMVSGRDTVVAVIETVLTPTADSRITFWDVQWQSVRADKVFKMPCIDDFILKTMPADMRDELSIVMAFPFIEMHFTGDRHDGIEAVFNAKESVGPGDYKRFAPYFKDTVNYRINGVKIRPVK